MLDTTHKSQLTLLIEARVKCSGKREKIFARVNSNCPLHWRGFKRGWLRDAAINFAFLLIYVSTGLGAERKQLQVGVYAQNFVSHL